MGKRELERGAGSSEVFGERLEDSPFLQVCWGMSKAHAWEAPPRQGGHLAPDKAARCGDLSDSDAGPVSHRIRNRGETEDRGRERQKAGNTRV